MTTTYTVSNSSGDVLARGVTSVEAAHVIMADDARAAEIRDFYKVNGHICDGLDEANEKVTYIRYDIMSDTPFDDDDAADMRERAAGIQPEFFAWYMCHQGVHDRRLGRTSYSSFEPDYDAAALEIALKIINSTSEWRRSYRVETDAEYDEAQAEFAHELMEV
jgi:hypothetical protein